MYGVFPCAEQGVPNSRTGVPAECWHHRKGPPESTFAQNNICVLCNKRKCSHGGAMSFWLISGSLYSKQLEFRLALHPGLRVGVPLLWILFSSPSLPILGVSPAMGICLTAALSSLPGWAFVSWVGEGTWLLLCAEGWWQPICFLCFGRLPH